MVTADYRPVSIAVEGKQESGTIRVAGRSRGASFAVTATVAGIERSGVFDRPEAILARALPRRLAGRSPAGVRGGRGHAAGRGVLHAQAGEGQAARRPPRATGRILVGRLGPPGRR